MDPFTRSINSYTVAYVDFFDEEVKERNGEWKSVLEEYLYDTAEPIINGFAGGRTFDFRLRLLYIANP